MGENKFRYDYIENFIKPHLLSNQAKNEPILLALSGGVDSTLLLYMLLLYRQETKSPIYAAHIEHGIRGDEALRDLEFCRRICLENDVEFFELSADVPLIAKEQKKSIELCARDTRYNFFAKIMLENNIKILATAHNADDNTETLLFNIMRGSGIHGACGIPPLRDFNNGVIIRPLINIEKTKIIEFCENHNIEYVTDSTNERTEYSRNFIRANIVPLMKESNPYVNDNITKFCRIMKKNADYIYNQAESFICANIKHGKIPTQSLSQLHEALLAEVILQMYHNFCGGTLEFVHVEAILEQIYSNKPHFTLNLPKLVTACCKNCIFSFEYLCNKIEKEDYNIKVDKLNNLYFIDDFLVEFSDEDNLLDKKDYIDKNIYKLATSNYINYDNIKSELFFRNRRAGDTIHLNSMHKKVKKLFCDYKIPVGYRDNLPLLCCDNKIVWVPFVGVCDDFRCKDENKYKKLKLYVLQK